MSNAPIAVFHEDGEVHKGRVVKWYMSTGKVVLALIGLSVLDWMEIDIFVSYIWVYAGLILIGVLVFAQSVLAARMTTELYRVDADGLTIRAESGKVDRILWDHVNCIDTRHPEDGELKTRFTFGVERPGGAKESIILPLHLMPETISEQFKHALRVYWPDLDLPWQEQIARRNGLDSRAG